MSAPPNLVISLAARPGVFGKTVHNAGYAALKLNFQYKPMRTDDLAMALRSVRNLGIRGCSLTMPYKVEALKYLDKISPLANAVGAVNTIVNENGKLIGHNTDVIGAVSLLDGYQYLPWLILGAGGMARAFLQAAKILRVPHVYLSARGRGGAALAKKFKAEFLPWEKRETIKGCAILNATPMGMAPHVNETPMSLAAVAKAQLVFDAVPKPVETRLVRAARRAKLPVITGRDLALAQAYAQFELYTGKPAPRRAMIAAAKTLQ
jgi:shikimate dehydrogenase